MMPANDGRLRRDRPGRQQLVEHRVEPLLRRVPRLEQVVVEVDVVDGPDRGVGVGVRGEQHPLGVGDDVHRLLEEVDAGHAGHPVVGQQQRDLLAAQVQLAQRVERARAVLGAHHAVRLAVAAAQVAGQGAADRRVVVDGEQDRTGHRRAGAGAVDSGQVTASARSRRRSTTASPRRARSTARPGAPLLREWAVACRRGELSQQPTCPQLVHRRRCTQRVPSARQSPQARRAVRRRRAAAGRRRGRRCRRACRWPSRPPRPAPRRALILSHRGPGVTAGNTVDRVGLAV